MFEQHLALSNGKKQLGLRRTLDAMSRYPIFSVLLFALNMGINHAEVSHPLLSRHKRALLFRDGAYMGLFVALALPVHLTKHSVSTSFNFEGNYFLPYNATQLPDFYTDVIVARGIRSLRDIDRRTTYEVLEKRLNGIGLQGRNCLLRVVCEVAETPIRHSGLLGDVLHIIFTPSSSSDEDLPKEFADAEKHGQQGQSCTEKYGSCYTSLLDFVSFFHKLQY